MKYCATISVVLIQFWLLSPVCCCWFQEDQPAGGPDCCCADGPVTDGSRPNGDNRPADTDSNCRCSSGKIELPSENRSPPLGGSPWAFYQIVAAERRIAVETTLDGARRFIEAPPPLTVAHRLSQLQQFNL